MKLYENVIIGNFLYGLGLSIGRALPEQRTLSVVNLLQQTPADKSLGDMLVEFESVVRLIEFKNKGSSLKKEKNKQTQLITALIGQNDLIAVSREAHWYVETEPFEEKCANNITPYLEAFSGASSSYTLEGFIGSITHAVKSPQKKFTAEQLKAYLAVVAACQGDGKVGTGGIIVSVDKDGIKYLQYADIMQLRLQHKEFVLKMKNEYESIMKLSLEKELELEKKVQHTRSRSPGLGA
ncbi:hypothetical protein [Arsukibacterium sp.]|uniref:hypothetical protein n=1 Tax=Arsukibacterium sp. TaxID=1977258 RepID=UPI00299E623C|nr:hypothetical protein [Arsukibacterium sp.]MDX1539587.1 hypothetical protein [Arsukibacterium sp.]